MRKYLFLMVALLMPLCIQAQRAMDKLDRGLIAMKVSTGVYVSWRLLGEEYYDVKFNLYRDGTKIAEGLQVTNYTDAAGTTSSKYTVTAVVRGKEQTQSKSVTPWASSYMEVKLAHKDIKSTLVPNDACCADVDGDGELEVLMKFDNQEEIAQGFPKAGSTVNGVATGEYSIFEVFKLNGTRLWWVNCGPNMGDFQNNEQNIVGYDWDLDGKAEVVMRLKEGSTIHMADGTTYTIGANGQNGTSWTNYRSPKTGGVEWFTPYGKEFLVYCNGATGNIYQCIDFPLARLEAGESDLNKAWGDGYGHRCSKFFFGAPYLDGKKPSIFLARGIYTRHKMVALDVDPATHKLTQRWKWYNNTNGSWKGQGYHNYSIADVDWDGRDEICFGSMVIDDNGMGLSTSGLGHGDAHHVGNFNPYAHGQQIYACNEDRQGHNYRDATTSTIYFSELGVGKDVGRSMMDNFSDSYPGSIGCAWGDPVSSVTNGRVSGMASTGINSNFRIYWDGDLCSETFNYLNGKNTEGCIAKYGSWSPIYTCEGSMTNNDTKGTPCYQGDILGDWREEIIMRTADNNVRIYSTPKSTEYRMPTLWADHQYRNAMVHQMCGYNQPPHVSFFVGKLEGITMAPPPVTNNDREMLSAGATLGTSMNDKAVVAYETANSTFAIAQGAAPALLTINVPTWVQGSGASETTATKPAIKYATYTCDVTGAGITGTGRLVKQGDGILNLPKADFTHSGNTDIWAGVVNFDGTMKQSSLWLNRFAELNSNGGVFRSIKADYAAVVRPGGENGKGNITTDSLSLGFGSRIVVDLYSADKTADQLAINKYLSIEKKSGIWLTAGPKYIQPVIEVVGHMAEGETKMTPGKYVIATLAADVQLVGSVSDILLEGLTTTKKLLYVEDNKLILEIVGVRDAGDVTWTGAQSGNWDLAATENFAIGEKSEATVFVAGDNVTFDDNATTKIVTVAEALVPSQVKVNNTNAYTFKGSGAISGTASFVKEGSGTVSIGVDNSYTGGNYLKGGVTSVSVLAYDATHSTGNLGGLTTSTDKFTMENGAVLKTTAAVIQGSPMKMVGDLGGVIDNTADFKMNKAITGTLLTKKGSGSLFLNASSNVKTISVKAGGIALAAGSTSVSNTIDMSCVNGNIWDDGQNTAHTINVPKGYSATWSLSGTYYTAYGNKLTGEGTLTIVPRNTVSRVRITGNWSQFYGTIKHTTSSIWLPLDINGTAASPVNATIDIASGCTVGNVPGKTITIGAVTGSGNLCNIGCNLYNGNSVTGVATWNIGNDTKDFTFSGAINDNSSSNTSAFNKIGTCTMAVKGAWGLTGAVTVKEGTLKCSGSTLSLGTGKLTISNGATMTVYSSNALKNASVVVNGTLWPGYSATSALGKAVFNKQNVTINATGALKMNIKQKSTSATSYSGDYIKSIGTLTINGTIDLTLLDSYTPAVGDEIRLWSDVTKFVGTPTIKCSNENVIFDSSRLAEGVLVVKEIVATSIKELPADEQVMVTVLNAAGMPVASYTAQGSDVVTALYRQGLPAGNYIIAIKTANGIISEKRVIR